MKFAMLATLAGLALAPSAYAQNVVMMNGNGNFPNLNRPGMVGADRSQIITINFQFNFSAKPGATDADVTKTMAEASQSLYDIVDHECAVLAASLKGNCRLVQMNVGGNINTRGNPSTTVAANAAATYEISPLPVTEPAPPK